MNRQQVNIMLRHRDSAGKIDLDALLAAQRERQRKDEPEPEPELVYIRRLQGWPEYLIQKSLRGLKGQ